MFPVENGELSILNCHSGTQQRNNVVQERNCSPNTPRMSGKRQDSCLSEGKERLKPAKAIHNCLAKPYAETALSPVQKKPSLSSPRPFDLALRHDLAIRARKQPQRLAEGAIVCISTFFPARYHFDKFYGRMARLCDKRAVPFLLHFQGLTQVDVCVEQNVVVLEPHTEKNS